MLIYWLIYPLLLLRASCLAPSQSAQPPSDRPNVLFITVDDMNGWGTLNQYPGVKMPNIDRFKKRAYHFTSAVCASPVCIPSRASFFSGVFPHKSGAYYNGCEPWIGTSILKTTEVMPECFKRNGYETFGRGKIFHAELEAGREEAMFDNRPIYKGGFGPFAKKQDWMGNGGFSSVKAWDGPDSDFPDVKNAEAAIEFLQKPHAKPFFCYVGYWRPHTPYTAPKRFFDLYNEADMTETAGYNPNDLDDVPKQGRDLVDSLQEFGKTKAERHQHFRRMMYGYCATLSFADWSVGRVLDALDKSAFAKNTIVVVASDNGYHMGEKERWQKGTLWELSAYAPLLIRLPNGKAFTCPQTVSLLDIYPTLVEYCKLDGPRHKLDGTSLMPIFRDPKQPRGPSFMSYGEHYSSVRDNRYRYIQYPDGSSELYDHQADPHEWTNRTQDLKLTAVKKRLQKQIPTEWAKSLGGETEAYRDIVRGKEVNSK